MSKLVKSVVYPFTGDQPPLTPTDHKAIPSREDVVAFYRTHERFSWSLTEFLDIPWSAIDVDLLTPTDVFVVESALLVESNNPDYVANLIEYFKADQDVCDFVMMWAMEEWKHYYVLADYLTKVRTALAARAQTLPQTRLSDTEIAAIESAIRRALGDDIAAVREASADNWGIPNHYLPAQVVANTTFQEFVTAEFYRNHAQQTKEPILARIEALLAKDETRHEMFYEARVKDCLEREPDLMPLIIESLKEFGMPGAYLLGDYEVRRAAMEAAAFPTLAAKKDAFVRIFGKMTRVVGHDNAMRVFTEGNYLSDGQPDPSRRKMRPEMITRLVSRKVAAG